MSDDLIPLEVHFENEGEMAQAKQALEDVDGQEITEFDGFVSGLVERDAVEEVGACGLLVAPADEIVEQSSAAGLASESSQLDSLFPGSVLEDHQAQLLDNFRKLSSHVHLVQASEDEVRPQASGAGLESQPRSVPAEYRLEALSVPRTERDPRLDGFSYEDPGGAAQMVPEEDEVLPRDAYLVRLTGSIRPEWSDKLSDIGVELTNHRPPHTYTMLIDSEQLPKLEALEFVRAVKRYSLTETISKDFQEHLAAASKAVQPGALTTEPRPEMFEITLHSKEHLDQVVSMIEASTGQKISEAAWRQFRFEATLDSPVLSALASLPQVAQVSLYNPPTLFSDHVRKLIGVEKVLVRPAPETPLDGEGEIVAVLDSGIDKDHPDLKNRIQDALAFRGGAVDDTVGHGTHVAGIIAGNGASSNKVIRGVAPAAKLITVGIVTSGGALDLPIDLGELLQIPYDKGARIMNLSWGRKLSGDYESGALSIDKFVREHPDALVIIAAGNEGRARDGQHEFSTLGSPASAKNALTVGACPSDRPDTDLWGTRNPGNFPKAPASDEPVSGDADTTAAMSSRGPTDYQSIKPDVLAPGTRVVAARASASNGKKFPGFEDYTEKTGTSMATPAVAGAAAILRQYLKGRDALQPSAALMKALLIASCKKVATINRNPAEVMTKIGFPDFDQGHGRIDLRNIIPHDETPENYQTIWVDVADGDQDSLTSGQLVNAASGKTTRRLKIKTPDSVTAPLKVVLTFTDLPGSYPQNKLNLQLIESGGSRWSGNPDHHFTDTVVFPGLSNPDRSNTVEQVTVATPKPNTTYIIKVMARNTPLPKQGYAVAVCGQMQGEGFV